MATNPVLSLEMTPNQKLLNTLLARSADVVAWIRSGNDIPHEFPFEFKLRYAKIVSDIEALSKAVDNARPLLHTIRELELRTSYMDRSSEL